MSKNGIRGDGRRMGQVTGRSQVFNPLLRRWIKRQSSTGRFMAQSAGTKPFKGVRREHRA